MAFTAALNDIFEFTIKGRMNNQSIWTIRHYIVTAISGTPDRFAASLDFATGQDSLGSSVLNALSACQTNQLTYDSLRMQWVSPTRFAYTDYMPVSTTGGASTSDALTQNLAAVVLLRSPFPGRTGRGEIHVGGIPSDSISGGTIINPLLGNLASLGTQIKTAIPLTPTGGTLTLTPIIYHRANPTVSALINDFTVELECRTMRRRTIGRGI